MPADLRFEILRDAFEKLYYAAYWRPDRIVDSKKLWEDVRDAAGLTPGQSFSRLGPERNPTYYMPGEAD